MYEMNHINECYKQATAHFDQCSKELDKLHEEIEKLETQMTQIDRSKEACSSIAKTFIEEELDFLFQHTEDGGGVFKPASIHPMEIIVVDSNLIVFSWDSPLIKGPIEKEKIEELTTLDVCVTTLYKRNGMCQVNLTYEVLFDVDEIPGIAEYVSMLRLDFQNDIDTVYHFHNAYLV